MNWLSTMTVFVALVCVSRSAIYAVDSAQAPDALFQSLLKTETEDAPNEIYAIFRSMPLDAQEEILAQCLRGMCMNDRAAIRQKSAWLAGKLLGTTIPNLDQNATKEQVSEAKTIVLECIMKKREKETDAVRIAVSKMPLYKRLELASSKSTSQAMFAALINDVNSGVRYALATNVRTHPRLLATLATDDEIEAIRKAAVFNLEVARTGIDIVTSTGIGGTDSHGRTEGTDLHGAGEFVADVLDRMKQGQDIDSATLDRLVDICELALDSTSDESQAYPLFHKAARGLIDYSPDDIEGRLGVYNVQSRLVGMILERQYKIVGKPEQDVQRVNALLKDFMANVVGRIIPDFKPRHARFNVPRYIPKSASDPEIQREWERRIADNTLNTLLNTEQHRLTSLRLAYESMISNFVAETEGTDQTTGTTLNGAAETPRSH